MLRKLKNRRKKSMDSNINSTFPKTQKKVIYVELNIYQ